MFRVGGYSILNQKDLEAWVPKLDEYGVPEEYPDEYPDLRTTKNHDFKLYGKFGVIVDELWEKYKDFEKVRQRITEKHLCASQQMTVEESANMAVLYLKRLMFVYESYIGGGLWGIRRANPEVPLGLAEYGFSKVDQASQLGRNFWEEPPEVDSEEFLNRQTLPEKNFSHLVKEKEKRIQKFNNLVDEILAAPYERKLRWLEQQVTIARFGNKANPDITWEQFMCLKLELRYREYELIPRENKMERVMAKRRWQTWADKISAYDQKYSK